MGGTAVVEVEVVAGASLVDVDDTVEVVGAWLLDGDEVTIVEAGPMLVTSWVGPWPVEGVGVVSPGWAAAATDVVIGTWGWVTS